MTRLPHPRMYVTCSIHAKQFNQKQNIVFLFLFILSFLSAASQLPANLFQFNGEGMANHLAAGADNLIFR